MAKKNKVAVIKDADCLNCGYPFTHDEKFCPECGQKNRGKKITLSVFLRELFAGFFSWDAKFWKTITPLLTKPGKVSKDYIEGKRIRYTNPFRFYLATSIIFFLIVNLTDNYNKFDELRNGKSSKESPLIQINKSGTEAIQESLDSIQGVVIQELEKQTPIEAEQILPKKDSAKSKSESQKLLMALGIDENNPINKFMKHQEKHPNMAIDDALDKLKVEKNFSNRFLYSRVEVVNSIVSKKTEQRKFTRQLLSYASLSLFILLPLLTLFLKAIYFRKKYTYVEHLVFVFHIQTVFFLLLSIFYIIDFFKETSNFLSVILLLFLIYLFLAMKTFYEQGYFKTFFKYILVNIAFFILSAFGAIAIALATFTLY